MLQQRLGHLLRQRQLQTQRVSINVKDFYAKFFADQATSSNSVADDEFGSAAEAAQYAPPTQIPGTAGRYASALYMAGARVKKLTQIEEDLSKVDKAAAGSQELNEFLKDPTIPQRPKQEALSELLEKMEVQELTKNFFGLLAENNRLGEYTKISSAFSELVAASRGEIVVTLTTAEGLAKEDVEGISKRLREVLKLKEGQSLQIKKQIDPSLIDGIILDIGDQRIDFSISSQIKKIQKMMLDSA